MSSPVGSISDTYTGGFPTLHQDLGPCILFGILYLITTGVTGWRISQYRRCKRVFWSFIRMTIFQLLRITTMILRAVDGKNIQDIIEGKGNFNEGLFIGEQVLISIGYLFLASTLTKFTILHDLRDEVWETAKRQKRFTSFIDLLLFATAVLLSATAYDYSNTAYRKAATIMALSALVLLLGFNVQISRRPHLPKKASHWLIFTILLLIIVPCYRLSMLFNPPKDSSSDGRKAEFYILQITIEWLVAVSLLAVDVMQMCDIDKDRNGVAKVASGSGSAVDVEKA